MKKKRDQNVLSLISPLSGMDCKYVHVLNVNPMYDEGVCAIKVRCFEY